MGIIIRNKTKMFKTLTGLALAVPALADRAAGGCQAITTTSGTVFNIEDLEGPMDYTFDLPYLNGVTLPGVLTWNYCDYVETAQTSAYATFNPTIGAVDHIIASKKVATMSATNIRDPNDDTKTIGVSFMQDSETQCHNVISNTSGHTFSLQTDLYCNADLTGAATVRSAKQSTENTCIFMVEMEHASGCPIIKFDTDVYMGWLADNGWCTGIIYLVVGFILMFFGLQWFPYITASLIAVFIIGVSYQLGMSLGWTVTVGGLIGVLIAGLVLGIVAGCLVRRNVWAMIGLLGLVSGFFGGELIFALISAASGWDAAWGMWTISGTFALIGMIVACMFGKPIVLISTSFVGSYLFTLAWTLFFPGHWPTAADIMEGDTHVDAIFWVFLSVFIFLFAVSTTVQSKRAECHPDLESYSKA